MTDVGESRRTRGATEPIKRYMLGDQIKDYLLAQILEGDLFPGDRIVETRVARDLGISQGPVREALRDLATLGLVTLQPYRGARVRQRTLDEHVEGLRVRGELEVMAAREATGKLTADQITHLRCLTKEMAERAAASDPHGHALKNTEFHAVIARASENRTLERVLAILHPFAQTYLTVTVGGIKSPESYAQRHDAIIEALVTGDPLLVDEAMRAHNDANVAIIEASRAQKPHMPDRAPDAA